MPVLDFKEIASASGGPNRDQFELFGREFLELMGFVSIVGPDRGPDAGRDLIVEEVRTGAIGETRVRWLVSCKHKAHSGQSVTSEDEQDIHDRVRTHKCKGFMALYSTVPSSGLATKLNATDVGFEVQVFDQERIEKHLLTASGISLARRFFPISVTSWEKEHPRAAKIFKDEPHLTCHYCEKDLLQPKPHGNVVIWTRFSEAEELRKTEHLYWCCAGNCDHILKAKYYHLGIIDGWESISDLVAPPAYIRWVVSVLNDFQREGAYSKEAFDSLKTLLLNLFPLVARDPTTKERDRISDLSVIPHYLGGWGYE